MAVGAVCEGVEVGIIEENGKVAAYFPFQRSVRSIGIPAGGILSDYQGLICRPLFEFNPSELVKGCHLSAWDFDHLLGSQTCFMPFHQHHGKSPLIDLSEGYEAYVEERRATGSEQIKKCRNMVRRIERELGSLRFVSHSEDADLLQQVLSWKSQQYVVSSKHDLCSFEWVRSIIRRIHATQTKEFAGVLSALYAGDRLLAGHFGMRSRTVWHYWFPAYSAEYAKYSPGLILLLKMAEHAEQFGLRTIDLGGGLSLYKERLMNASIPLASGSVAVPSWLSLRRGMRLKLRAIAKGTPGAKKAWEVVTSFRG